MGGWRDGEHEVGLDRTMGRRVTFELLSTTRPDCESEGERFCAGICSFFLPMNEADFIEKRLVTHSIMSRLCPKCLSTLIPILRA